ncbi:hypothetical protein CH371_15510 [Leptospira wolffii]|uniref:Uncharacterized protein n=1 Tax=Leptospira wolffii TaxID=409998 RepID=A0A2M9Z8Z7_9LEPT|nr:hypothetical protein [Leptospira wolffii]PJZ64909.1 hypothetical protein CH371_15510 [Leptospira wolffii]
MIGELALVAQLSTSPIRRSDTQTFQEHRALFDGLSNIGNLTNYTQTNTISFNKFATVQFSTSGFFSNMRDLDELERAKYKELLNKKRTIIKKSIL